MAYNDWATATVHFANVDTNPAPYSEIPIASLTGLSGYGTMQIGILAPQHAFTFSGDVREDVHGEKDDRGRVVRLRFNLELYPFDYASGGAWTLDEYDELVSILNKKCKWISFDVTERTYHTAANAIPFVLDGEPEVSIDRETGTRTVTIPMLHKWPEA